MKSLDQHKNIHLQVDYALSFLQLYCVWKDPVVATVSFTLPGHILALEHPIVQLLFTMLSAHFYSFWAI